MKLATAASVAAAAQVESEEEPEEGVDERLRRYRECPTGCPYNLNLIFMEDTRWAGNVRYNQFDGQLYLRDHVIQDHGCAEARLWLNTVYGISASKSNVEEPYVS